MSTIEREAGAVASLWMVEHRTAVGHLADRLRGDRRGRAVRGARFGIVAADLGSTRTRGLAPGWTPLRRALGFALWPGPEAREECLAPLRAVWSHKARAWWEVDLSPVARHGSWRGDPLADVELAPHVGSGDPVAVLTLGRTPPRRFAEFTFRELPRIARDADGAHGLLHAAAAGSPLTGSVTFTVWQDDDAMRDFARGAGAHAQTVRNDARRGLLTEQLRLRLGVTGVRGEWDGSTDRAALTALANLR